MKYKISLFLSIFFFLFGGYIFYVYANEMNKKNTEKTFIDTENKNIPEIIVNEQSAKKIKKISQTINKSEIEKSSTHGEKLPESINLNVPFYPQAPDGDWSLPWKEACEESSLILAYYFVKSQPLDKQTFTNDILEMVELQKKLFNKYIDTSIVETAELLEEFYNYSDYKIITQPTKKDIKQELAKGNPIIAPFAGKKLGNSYFTNGGPRYHVLVITGYDDQQNVFFTNDVGTSRGEHFPYEQEVIMDALHDLVPKGKGQITSGEKRILVIQ